MWTYFLVLCSILLLKNGGEGLHVHRQYKTFSKTENQFPKICVIGAGYSGLGTARYMSQYGLNFTVFEATRHIGGNWRFDPHVDKDEDGVPVFTSMYKGLRTNTPRQTMEYEGFPFPRKTPIFPFGTCFYKYLQSFTKHFDLMKYIRFRRLVTNIKWESDRWNITYIKTGSKTKVKETCNFVVVATGYFEKPVVPKFDGQENFKGNILHSHYYKSERPYTGRNVLVVGDGPSGRDLAMLLSNVTNKLFFSHHHFIGPSSVYKYVITKPDIKLFKSNGIIFEDDSFEEIDDVILCTGYAFDNQILDKNTDLAMSPKVLMPLYDHMVNIKHPSMIFVGKSKTAALKVYDAQAQYAAALAAQKFRLPSTDTMLRLWTEQVYSMLTNGSTINDLNVITETESYYEHLGEKIGVKKSLPTYDDLKDELQGVELYSSNENECTIQI